SHPPGRRSARGGLGGPAPTDRLDEHYSWHGEPTLRASHPEGDGASRYGLLTGSGVPNHWTYKSFQPGDDLSQGDIIARTEPVLGILRDIHAYFCNPKYLCFIVLTQSCDLVMRGGTCKARQIGLGVVRSLDDILSDNLAELCGTGFPGIYRRDARIAAQQF